jgi:hypothetical protein
MNCRVYWEETFYKIRNYFMNIISKIEYFSLCNLPWTLVLKEQNKRTGISSIERYCIHELYPVQTRN